MAVNPKMGLFRSFRILIHPGYALSIRQINRDVLLESIQISHRWWNICKNAIILTKSQL